MYFSQASSSYKTILPDFVMPCKNIFPFSFSIISLILNIFISSGKSLSIYLILSPILKFHLLSIIFLGSKYFSQKFSLYKYPLLLLVFPCIFLPSGVFEISSITIIFVCSGKYLFLLQLICYT